MADDILDIIHRIAFDVDDANLDRLTAQLRRQTETINHLGQRQARLAQAYDRTSATEIERRRRISSLMERNNTLLQQNSRSLENNVLNNRQLNDQLTREIGLIGAINARLDILHQRRRQATSETEVRRYSQLITREQSRLDSLNRVPRNRAAGFLGNLGQLAGAGTAISSLLPAVGGALSIASLGQQIFDVTKRFEGYSQTLKNAYGSSVKAQGAFDKIQQFAAKTPYGVDELTASFIKLKNRGFDPTTEELTKMGDLAASQGKSMDQYVEALLDAQTGEYERLKEFGIKAKTTGDMVTFSFKGVEKQVKKTDQEAIRNAIISFGELKGVVGGMAGQATTLEGKLSNMGDTWDSVMYNMGKSGKGFMSDMIDLANELLSAFNDMIEKSPAQQLREEQQEVNVLMSAIASLNTENQSRNILIAELNAKYPQLVANLNLENQTSGDILYTLQGINKAYERRISLAQQTSIKENLAKKQGKIFSNTAEDLSDPSFIGALKQTGFLDDFQKAAGNFKKQRDIIQLAKKELDKTSGLFTSYKNPLDGGHEDYLSYSIGLASGSKALSKLIKEVPALTKQQQLAEQGISTIKANNQKLFDLMYDKIKREGGIMEDGSIKQGFDLRKSLGLIGSGDFVAMFDEYAPDIKVPIKPTEDKKKQKKGKSPLAKAFEEIENEKKLRTELENKRKADAEERYRRDYEVDQNKFRLDLRLAKNKESHEKVLANIEIDISKKKAVALKTKKGEPGEKEKFQANLAGENANISQSKAKLAEIANEISDGAKKEIEEAIKNFNELNDQLYNLRDKTFENELAQLDDQHNKRLEQYRKQREELTKQIVAHEEQGNVIVVAQIKQNLARQNTVEQTETERYNNDRIHRIINNEILKNNKLLELQILAISDRSDREREDFEKNFSNKKEEIDTERKQLQDKHITDEQIQKAFFLQKSRLRKEQDKQERLIELDKQLQTLYLQNENYKKTLQIREEKGKNLTGIEKENNDKEIVILKDSLNRNEAEIQGAMRARKKIKDETIGTTVEEYVQMADAAAQSAQAIVSAFEQQAEREIEIRQRRVDQTREIADRGNAEALQEEERRLDKAVKQRQRFAKQQIAIKLLMQASQIALAIATAAGETGIAAPVGIAIVLAALATGFAAVKGFQQDTPAFKDGVIGFNGKGTGTSDSNLVRISNGESVITAEATAKNKAILEEINAGKVFKPLEFNPGNVQPMPSSSSNSYDFQRLEGEIISLKQELKEAIRERTPNSISIDRRGFMAMTEEINTVNRKRSNL
ncbi:hypothetical protein NAL32_07490 [Chryseobacterium sp. Ch-15]|uniref:Uncharacterized protein n=1 Tax=Chryseobacterium muglaense TaxID=2893752 RepID=A0A9Q3YQ83_9FLAO|nr:hypothetical protein [Chryseobacterium muglaense]MCC9032708.1 hypothetical protein [Chryseobacterium muglaense]MCM2554235.1 hypothetical protein [Chryseobacterium muglaense]